MFFIQTIKNYFEAKKASRAADKFVEDMLYCGEVVYKQISDLENYGVDLKKHLQGFEVSEVKEYGYLPIDKRWTFDISFRPTDRIKIKINRFSNSDLAKRLGYKDTTFHALTVYVDDEEVIPSVETYTKFAQMAIKYLNEMFRNYLKEQQEKVAEVLKETEEKED